MEWRQLGGSDIVVSQACIGAMMWGEQVSSATAHEMLDVAFDEFGVNFIVSYCSVPFISLGPCAYCSVSEFLFLRTQDTSELYPAPPDPDTFGAADRIIGSWLKTRQRSDVVLATKVAGYSEDISWLRKGSTPGTRASKSQIIESVDASLKRLGTDYIDLLQIEWPDRHTGSNMAAFDAKVCSARNDHLLATL
jgi:aryl-alcohol dehydrogenase-like predicted oxidoreductase